MGLSMRGIRAEVRLGYQVAAVLGAWEFRTLEEGGWQVDANVETANLIYLAKTPLVLDLPQGRKTLRFHNVTVQDLGQRMKVRGTERPEQR